MDTRTKIVEPGAIPRSGRRVRVVKGYFDPVYADTVRRLRTLCRPDAVNVVAVASPGSPLLPWRARAELVAGMECVDYVIDAAASFDADEVQDERAADVRSTDALVELVVSRHE